MSPIKSISQILNTSPGDYYNNGVYHGRNNITPPDWWINCLNPRNKSAYEAGKEHGKTQPPIQFRHNFLNLKL